MAYGSLMPRMQPPIGGKIDANFVLGRRDGLVFDATSSIMGQRVTVRVPSNADLSTLWLFMYLPRNSSNEGSETILGVGDGTTDFTHLHGSGLTGEHNIYCMKVANYDPIPVRLQFPSGERIQPRRDGFWIFVHGFTAPPRLKSYFRKSLSGPTLTTLDAKLTGTENALVICGYETSGYTWADANVTPEVIGINRTGGLLQDTGTRPAGPGYEVLPDTPYRVNSGFFGGILPKGGIRFQGAGNGQNPAGCSLSIRDGFLIY